MSPMTSLGNARREVETVGVMSIKNTVLTLEIVMSHRDCVHKLDLSTFTEIEDRAIALLSTSGIEMVRSTHLSAATSDHSSKSGGEEGMLDAKSDSYTFFQTVRSLCHTKSSGDSFQWKPILAYQILRLGQLPFPPAGSATSDSSKQRVSS